MSDEVEVLAEPPGRYLSVAASDAFKSRVKPAARRQMSPEQRLWADAVQAAVELNALGLQPTLDLLYQRMRGRWARRTLMELLATEKWANAMVARGIPFDQVADTLTPLQLSFLSLYFDVTTPGTHTNKLSQAGVSADQFRGWMRQPVFAREMERLRQTVLKDGFAAATQALARKAESGDIQAIDRMMAFNGEDFRTLTGDDVKATLDAVFEVLDEENVDAAVLRKIAARINGTPAGVAATMKATTTLILPEAPQ